MGGSEVAARLLLAAALSLAVAATACTRGSSPFTGEAMWPGDGGGPALSRPPASPTAARILALPRTPSPAPTATGGAEALLRRVTLYPTDVPAELVGQPPELEDAGTAAARAPDPAAFQERARAWGRTLSLRTVFAATPATGRSVTVVTIHFASPDGARAQFHRFEAEGTGAVRADAGLDDRTLPGERAQAAAPPAAGEEALRWRWAAADTEPAGEAVVLRRGAFVAVVVVTGGGDAAALAQVVDGRAVATQQGGR